MFPERKIKLVLAYDGTDYHGWQIQPKCRTDAGVRWRVTL
jgi:tRNA U38,U39,U40 pseudouridine synthase TruA